MAGPQDAIQGYLKQSGDALQRLSQDRAFVTNIGAIVTMMTDALRAGNKILIAGNGGSAADAQHIAAELVGRFGDDRPPLAAIALTTDTSALTAIGNDYGFEQVFERQIRALGKKGDVFLAISTSGTSPNVIAALKAARTIGIRNVGFSGPDVEAMKPLCDIVLASPGEQTAFGPASASIQQIYMTAAHVICGLIERELFPPKS